ncbi:MAG TPA: hypothetical protein VL992_12970 [Tepidisphaeraceae bacterium]|nr:hypothetical protein [Tepidisphaeraceae bacterium]
MTTAPKKSPRGISLAISVMIVIACLIAGGGFIWWTFKNTVQTDTVTLSDADVADMRSAGMRLQYQGNGGVPINAGQFGPGTIRPSPFAPSPQSPTIDSISISGDVTIIRCGNVIVRVQPKAIPVMTFRQRYWGLLQEPAVPPLYTIARRIVHEDAVQAQLAVTPQQLASLSPIVQSPAVRQAYLTSLPVTVEDEHKAEQAWADYTSKSHAANSASRAALQAELLRTIRGIGDTALTTARNQYSLAQKQLAAIITVRQIQAYMNSHSLAAAH